MSDPVIHIENLHKRFGRCTVLDGLNLDVPTGAIFGFLGVNGAGKTTTIKTMLGMLRPDQGLCRVAGIDAAADPIGVRQRVGYMAENQVMYGWMSVAEIIRWCGRLHATWDPALADSLREQMNLSPKQKVGQLSKGQSSRLALLLALAHQPDVVILDDPTLGLDPIARKDFLRDVIGQLQSRNVTVFFSSHLLYEIEPVCDRVAILQGGRAVVCESVDTLRERVKRIAFRPAAEPHVGDVPGLLDARWDGRDCVLTVADANAAREAIATMSANGMAASDLSLDEIFEAYVVGRKELAT